MTTTPCQRWRKRHDSYRPAGEPIDSARYSVEILDERPAKAFIVEHHYSGTYPAARLRVGLWQARRPGPGVDLVGVAVFSVPPSQAVIPRWTGLAPDSGVELGRFVLLDTVPGNGESWFLARAMALLEAQIPDARALMSCSDPARRRGPDGRIITPGHVGTIYQASNARHVGRTGRSTVYLAPSGQLVSARALSKLRTGDCGAAYAEEQLLELGAPARAAGESAASWVRRLRASGWLHSARHPGNLVYLWALGDRRQRRQIEAGFPAAVRYPKAQGEVVELIPRQAPDQGDAR